MKHSTAGYIVFAVSVVLFFCIGISVPLQWSDLRESTAIVEKIEKTDPEIVGISLYGKIVEQSFYQSFQRKEFLYYSQVSGTKTIDLRSGKQYKTIEEEGSWTIYNKELFFNTNCGDEVTIILDEVSQVLSWSFYHNSFPLVEEN